MATREPGTVTVTVLTKGLGALDRGATYQLEFSRLPGETFGPYRFRDAREQLNVAALLDRPDARDLLLDAWQAGAATRPMR